MAVEFAKLYSTNGKLLYDEYFQRLKEEEENRVREHDAASLIQLKWHEYKERKYRKLLIMAIIRIQKSFRGYISRKRTKKKIIEENRLKHQQYYNERAVLIQKIWRGYYSRKEIFDFYAYKTYLKEVTDHTFKVNEEINRHAEQQRKQMESIFLENEEKKIQDLAGKIHHIISTKVIDGICKTPNKELAKMYKEKAYEKELENVGLLSDNSTKKIIYNNRKSSKVVSPIFNPKHQHYLSTPSSKMTVNSDFKNSQYISQNSSHRNSWSASTIKDSSRGTLNSPPAYASYETGLTEECLNSCSPSLQDMYTINENQISHLNPADKEYSGYEFKYLTDILRKKDKLLPPISSIPESVIKNSEALKEYKKKNINRPKSSIPLRKKIVFKENIPKEYLKKKADGPFLPSYMLNRTLNKKEKADSSLHNQTDIYESINKFKEEQIEKDKNILFGPFKLSKHPPPFKHINALEHNEPWVQPKAPNT
ncbi:hypothetical protein BCR36DRAFT_410131, partial [Piromyces finnis]